MARVLVVDDEQDIRYFLRRIFEMAGHEVIEAPNGAAALEMVAHDRPDLIFTDLMMPILDGNELIDRLRLDPDTASIPIVSLTGNPESSVGADVVLTKLPSPAELVATVLSVLKGA